MKEVNLELR